MKCSEFEKRIYLYDELTPHEREEADAHLRTCAHCLQHMEHSALMRQVVIDSRSQTPSLPNHAAMTRRIMDAVAATDAKKRPAIEHVFRKIILAPVRYQLAVFSMALVAFFLSEYTAGSEDIQLVKHHPGLVDPRTELNLASFHSAFLKARSEENQASTTSLSYCLASCLGAPNADCKACMNKFRKPD